MSARDTARGQRGAIAWMAGNSVAANLLMLVFLVGGLVGLSSIATAFNTFLEEI